MGRALTLLLLALLLLVAPIGGHGKKLIIVFDGEDAGAGGAEQQRPLELSGEAAAEPLEEETLTELEDTGNQDLDPGSWRQEFEEGSDDYNYTRSIRKLIQSVSEGEAEELQDAIRELQASADRGHAHSQSTLASLFAHGFGVEANDIKAHLFHYFAAQGGNYQSKMALAYTYLRQQLTEEAVKLYAELAAAAVSSLVSSKENPLVDQVRLNDGSEENTESLKKFRGEDDDDFQFLEYQARKGNAQAMYKIGAFYYFGLRGVRRDHVKALSWFRKAVDKGESMALEYLGELYARGLGIERNYTKALGYFRKALQERRYSALNGIGYLYSIGKGVDKRNLTTAKDLFKRAADHDDPNGHYNLGVFYLKGIGVKKDVKQATTHFVMAANTGHAKAYFQLARMQHKGIGMKKDLEIAAELYKMVAERGPWGSILRWALECYLHGDIGLSLFLYSRAAELGYEVAQSNAAWILQRYPDEHICLGSSGFCTPSERHERAHTLWRHASEQGNEFAALLIGDAYYYGRGTDKDLERAAAAYRLAGEQRNAQAYFNLGYMHEHGLGLPLDYHLAKRFYDQALETDNAALLPVYLALAGLWLRQRDGEGVLVKLIDSLPSLRERGASFLQDFSMDEGNATLIALVVCLATVLYLRRQRRNHAAAAA